MTTQELPVELDVVGHAAPPRANGELMFAEPWESRAFGLTLALHQSGRFEWDAFREELIAAIARWEADHPDHDGYRYYVCWLDALQRLLGDRGVVPSDAVDGRAVELAARPAGHDHDHDHEHDDHEHHGA